MSSNEPESNTSETSKPESASGAVLRPVPAADPDPSPGTKGKTTTETLRMPVNVKTTKTRTPDPKSYPSQGNPSDPTPGSRPRPESATQTDGAGRGNSRQRPGGTPPSGSADPKQAAAASKPPVDLIPPLALLATACAFANGLKYGRHSWLLVGQGAAAESKGTYIGAALRHIMAYQFGETVDPDSGVDHLAHAAASLLICLELDIRKLGKDDRPLTPAPAAPTPRGQRPAAVEAAQQMLAGLPAFTPRELVDADKPHPFHGNVAHPCAICGAAITDTRHVPYANPKDAPR